MIDPGPVRLPPSGREQGETLYGSPIHAWDDPRLVKLDLAPWYPGGLELNWQPDERCRSFLLHTMVRGPMVAVLNQLAEWESLHLIQTYSGFFSPRNKKGGVDPSTHHWAAAIDLNTGVNSWKTRGSMPFPVIEAFERYGWVYGGRWGTPDPMHFQYWRDY